MVLVCRRGSDLEIGRNGCTVATYILAGSIGTREWCLALWKVKRFGRWQKPPAPEVCCLLMLTATATGGLWPGIHQVGDVNGAQAGGEVPAGFCRVRLKQFLIRPGKYSILVQSGTVTVIGAIARHGDISGGHVVENTGRRYTPLPRFELQAFNWLVFGSAALPYSSLARSYRIGSGFPCGAPRFLINEGLNAGELRRRKGSAPGAIEKGVYSVGVIARIASLVRV